MRLYLEHRTLYLQYRQAADNLQKIINEYDLILQRVQPKSSLAEHEREFMPAAVQTKGQGVNKTEEYVIAVERARINERLADAKLILQERAELLAIKEAELRRSRDIYNVIYCARWVDGLKTGAIIRETGYSRSQVYNIMGQISRQIERSAN